MKMNNQFWWVEHDYDDPYKRLQYDLDKQKWVPEDEYTGEWFPGAFPCRSYKAAKRHLRKHTEIPKGTRFRLVSKFVRCDRYLTK